MIGVEKRKDLLKLLFKRSFNVLIVIFTCISKKIEYNSIKATLAKWGKL